MISPDAVRNVVGNIISFGLFLSHVPMFWRIIKNKDVEFKSDPYLATLLNCMLWVFCGILYVIFGSARYASPLTIMISHIHLLQSQVHVSLYQSVLFVIFPCQLCEMIVLKQKRDPVSRFLLVGHVVQSASTFRENPPSPFTLSNVQTAHELLKGKWTTRANVKVYTCIGSLWVMMQCGCFSSPCVVMKSACNASAVPF
ncbi:hypothetical protein VPH35_028756 [Triticum aestivum]